ncbi:MAG TPA: aspartyl protease family protein [Polyangia bacterium]|jgi:hypothetical protein
MNRDASLCFSDPDRRRARRGGGLAALLLLAAGCGGGSSGFATMGMPGIPSPSRVGSNLVFADVKVNGFGGGRLGVDTGSPLMLLDQTLFPGLMLPAEDVVTADVTVGDFTVDRVPLVQMQFGGAMDPLAFAGLFGGNVMRQFTVRLDYAHPDLAFRLGMPSMEPAVDGVEVPGAAIPFTLQGGGRGMLRAGGPIITFPATRIPLTVDVEGVSHPFILDTGASETTVRASVWSTVVADGRKQLPGLPISTVAGPGMATVSRVRSLTVGGATVTDPAVMNLGAPIYDMILDTIEQEVGHPVDGLLGGNFLREFMVTIDYPHGTLHLQRYTSATIVDEFKRVGIEIGPGPSTSAHRYLVGVVYQNTDAAAQGLHVGDELVSVDGQALDGLDSAAADDTLNGTVGSTHAIAFGKTTAAALQSSTANVLVEDLIPPPQ